MGDNAVFGAFNALLGVLGGQAATMAIFERHLWPQRHLSSLRLEGLPRLALVYSMGGPISTMALEFFDKAHANGLLAGAVQGHLLGTAFYRDLDTTYTLHALGNEPERQSQIRNCIWVQAITGLPMPKPPQRREQADEGNEEGRPEEKSTAGPPVRARITVDHLVLSKATPEDIANPDIPFVREDTGNVTLETLLAIFVTELSGVGVMIGVAIILRSLWSILFITPLVLRIISALMAVKREGVSDLDAAVNDEPRRNWEIDIPATEGQFVLVSGPPTVANQFFRHYGHPVRSRVREVTQMLVIVAFGVMFPVSLLCQVTWMPLTIQYVWTIWQVFLVLMMHIDRYTQKGTWRPSTDARLGQAFCKTRTLDFFNKCSETSVLFGQKRGGKGTVKATLNTTMASSYGEGKKCMKSLVNEAKEVNEAK